MITFCIFLFFYIGSMQKPKEHMSTNRQQDKRGQSKKKKEHTLYLIKRQQHFLYNPTVQRSDHCICFLLLSYFPIVSVDQTTNEKLKNYDG